MKYHGFVIAGFDKSKLAAVLYLSPTQPLYLFPRTLLTPTEEDRQTLSKNQLNKRQENPLVGERYQFTADEGSNIIKTFLKDSKVDTVKDWGEYAVYNTRCVISPGPVRQCWVPDFGMITVPKTRLNYLVPNVPIRISIKLEVDYGNINPAVDQITSLDQLTPTLNFSFGKFGAVVIDEDLDELVRRAPWNRLDPLIGFRYIDLNDWPDTPDEVAPADRRTPHGFPLYFRAIGLVIEPNEIFCKQRPEEPFYLPTLKSADYNFGIGAILTIYVRWEPVTRRYFVVDYAHDSILRTRYAPGGTIFLVDVKKSEKEARYYYNDTIGLVIDPRGVLTDTNDKTDAGAIQTVWAKYDGPRARCAFSIVRKAVVSEDAIDNARTGFWHRANEKKMIEKACNLDF